MDANKLKIGCGWIINFSNIHLNPENNDVQVLCDPSGGIIGVRKDTWRLNKWNFDLRVWEERYNMVVIESGSIGLLLAR